MMITEKEWLEKFGLCPFSTNCGYNKCDIDSGLCDYNRCPFVYWMNNG